MKLTVSMLKVLRQRRGILEDDDSQDKEIEKMIPYRIVKEMVSWYLGDGGWLDDIIYWMKCAEYKLKEEKK